MIFLRVWVVIAFVLSSCGIRPFQPPPPEFKTFVKVGATENQVKAKMRECGFVNSFQPEPTDTERDLARRELCMFRNGYLYKSGYRGICSTQAALRIAECKESPP